MKRSDRTILLILPLVALVVGFYLLAVAPKRDEISALDEEIASLREAVSIAEREIAVAEDARRRFGRNYADVVGLGAAVPEDSDQATFIYDLSRLGGRNSVKFSSFEVTASGAEAIAVPVDSTAPAPETENGAEAESGAEDEGTAAGDATATPAAVPIAATPTEAIAATLPIGSTIGPAGLPLMPYKLKFSGSFFDMADFFADLDDSVEVAAGKDPGDVGPEARGRLMTVNGFAMTGDPEFGFPRVQSSLSVTTYVVPPEQGISAGANPAGPAPATAPVSTSSGVPSGAQTAMVAR